MTTAVVDASAAVDLLVAHPRTPAVRAAFKRIDAIAPMLLDAEVLRALVRRVRQGKLSPEHADRALAFLSTAQIERLPIDHLVRDAWALRNNVSPFDSIYVALARRLGCPLVTCDRRLAGAPNLGITVTVVQA